MKAKVIFDKEDSRESIIIDLPQEPRKGENICLSESEYGEIEFISYPVESSDFDIILQLFEIDDHPINQANASE